MPITLHIANQPQNIVLGGLLILVILLGETGCTVAKVQERNLNVNTRQKTTSKNLNDNSLPSSLPGQRLYQGYIYSAYFEIATM